MKCFLIIVLFKERSMICEAQTAWVSSVLILYTFKAFYNYLITPAQIRLENIIYKSHL